jgi:hypothetical protein
VPTSIIFVFLIRAIVIVVGAFRRGRQAQPKSLCNECAFAHIQFGACGRRSISCTYGGGVRPMKLDVLYCTDYRPRAVPLRPAIGFIQEIASAE